jgi:transposase
MEQPFQYFVGIDWGTQTHRVAVLDGTGRPIEQYNADHSGEGLVTLVNKLKQRTACEPALVAIGIEVAWGALVETLVEGGFTVFSINPKQVDRFRDRFTVAGAKDDARDALVLSSSLYTDSQSYKRVEIDSPELIRLRELSRFQDELKIELRRVTNRLWQQLHRYYPQMLAISPAADDRLMWDLLEAAPTPAQGRKMSSLRVQRILKAHRIRKLSVDEVHVALRTAPLVLAPGAAEAASEHVQFLLPQVKLLDEHLREVSNRIKNLLSVMIEANAGTEQPPCDADLVLSIPGIGPAVAAALLTEAARPIRERDYEALRCYAGTAPVTRQSGKRKTVGMRQACSPRLRNAVFYWATSSLCCDSRSRKHYDALRAAGHQHPRALRGLADRLLGVLIALLKTQKTFDRVRRAGPLQTTVSLPSPQESGLPLQPAL